MLGKESNRENENAYKRVKNKLNFNYSQTLYPSHSHTEQQKINTNLIQLPYLNSSLQSELRNQLKITQ